ncbi:MAG: prepilin-type N-terminal cleavage/methylation domain-containing protein, partial [Thermodesulfobacterium sp.]|nr:prepilin-type N-terminal cleavage/methylation domain-containing protein [Thermodesulfobacterium sp.]
MERNSQGFSMFELLVALLLLLFIISGLAVGMRDYLKRQKSLELHTLARQILETEKAYLLNLPSNSIASLDRTFR